jgi:hypothetical protein
MLFRKPAAWLLAWSVALFAAAADPTSPAPVAQGESIRLPLAIMAAEQTMDDERDQKTTVTVGCLPDRQDARAPGFYEAFDEAQHQNELALYRTRLTPRQPLLESLRTGKLALQPPRAGKPVVALVVMKGGDNWTSSVPAALRRGRNVFSLETEFWTDNGGRDKSYPVQCLHLVSLGNLEAGEYRLNVVRKTLLRDVGPKNDNLHYYQPSGAQSGDLSFTIGKDAESAKGDAPKLAELAAVKAAEPPRTLQQPRYLARQIFRQRDGEKPQVLQVGKLDSAAFAKRSFEAAEVPKLEAPKAEDPVCAMVLGPQLNMGEWMALREVVWDGKQATLRVELWRDTGERTKNYVFGPMIVVPLHPPSTFEKAVNKFVTANGEYTVGVEWISLVADQPGGSYREKGKAPDRPNASPPKCTFTIGAATGSAPAKKDPGKDDF